MRTGMPSSHVTDADVAEAEVAEAEATDTAASGTQRKWRRVLLGALTALAVAATGCTGYLALRPAPPNVVPVVADDGSYIVGSLPSTDQARIVASAVRAVPDLLSYDYRSLDAAPDRARPHLTAEFEQEYQKTFQATVVPLATANRAVTKALVRGAGLIESSGDQGRCLVFVDQLLVSSSGTPGTQPASGASPTKVAQNRVMVSLTKRNDNWLVSGMIPF